jgi:hypothetical protein
MGPWKSCSALVQSVVPGEVPRLGGGIKCWKGGAGGRTANQSAMLLPRVVQLLRDCCARGALETRGGGVGGEGESSSVNTEQSSPSAWSAGTDRGARVIAEDEQKTSTR